MTDDTRQARIAAAEQAIDDAIWRLMGTRMSITGENLYQQVATAAIDAADAAAAAAPAVGVSELNEAIEKVRHAARVAGATGYDWAISAERSACQDLFALLTAQPEPGSDDAGQPATEGE